MDEQTHSHSLSAFIKFAEESGTITRTKLINFFSPAPETMAGRHIVSFKKFHDPFNPEEVWRTSVNIVRRFGRTIVNTRTGMAGTEWGEMEVLAAGFSALLEREIASSTRPTSLDCRILVVPERHRDAGIGGCVVFVNRFQLALGPEFLPLEAS